MGFPVPKHATGITEEMGGWGIVQGASEMNGAWLPALSGSVEGGQSGDAVDGTGHTPPPIKTSCCTLHNCLQKTMSANSPDDPNHACRCHFAHFP